MDGDFEEVAGSLVLSSFETGNGSMEVFLALKLKEPSQVNKLSNTKHTYTAESKTSWFWTDLKAFEGLEGSLARAFFGLSLVGLMDGIYQNKLFFEKYGMYLGTKTSSLSDSQTCKARFFPPGLFTGEGVGGGVISMLQKGK